MTTFEASTFSHIFKFLNFHVTFFIVYLLRSCVTQSFVIYLLLMRPINLKDNILFIFSLVISYFTYLDL